MNRLRPHVSARTLLLMSVGFTAATGCQYIGWFLENATPSPIKAEHKPEDIKTVVLVDDPKQLLTTPQMKGQIATKIGRDLIKNNVLSEDRLIDPGRITRARIDHTDFGRWYVEDIADHVGAEQVIHVQITDFHLGKLDDEYRPSATVRVKVWHIPERKQTFPDAESPRDYAEKRVRLQSIDPSFTTRTRSIALSQSLASAVADKTAKLFYDHPHKPWGTGVSFDEDD